jgi:hypothetical protein
LAIASNGIEGGVGRTKERADCHRVTEVGRKRRRGMIDAKAAVIMAWNV